MLLDPKLSTWSQLSIVSSTGASQPEQMQTRRRRCHGYSGAGVVELLSVKRRVAFVQSEGGALQSDGKGLQEVHRDTSGARQKGSSVYDDTSGSKEK